MKFTNEACFLAILKFDDNIYVILPLFLLKIPKTPKNPKNPNYRIGSCVLAKSVSIFGISALFHLYATFL